MKILSKPTAAGRPSDLSSTTRASHRGPNDVIGPVPVAWIVAASQLPGRSLHAGLALWWSARTARSMSVALNNLSSREFGVDRNQKYRALQWLEAAGLITVERKLGRAPIVTILIPASPP